MTGISNANHQAKYLVPQGNINFSESEDDVMGFNLSETKLKGNLGT